MDDALDPVAKAQAFREGFLEGARALLKGVGNDMAEEQKRVLEKWVNGPVAAGRDAGPDVVRPELPAIDGA